jgi:hypothetical protein
LSIQADRAGFVNITIAEFVVPISRWAEDPKMKDIRAWQKFALINSLDAFSLAIFTRLLKWSLGGINVLLAEVKTELAKRSYHWY